MAFRWIHTLGLALGWLQRNFFGALSGIKHAILKRRSVNSTTVSEIQTRPFSRPIHPKIDPSMWQSWWRLWGVGQRAVGRPVGSAGAWCFCSLRSCGANVVLEKHPTEAIKCDSYWVWTRHRSSVGPYSSLLDSWSKEVQLANFRVEDTPIQPNR